MIYRMHDSDNRGCFLLRPGEDAHGWNRQGFGIFWTVNQFRDGVRRIDHLERILAWAIDMDEGTKEEQRARLHKSPLEPSLVVETKRGFQAYWNAKDGLPEHWNAIMLERLVPFFGADRNARDIARILRVPGFMHMKDPANPFLVREEWKLEVGYTEAQMKKAFPHIPKEDPKKVHDRVKRDVKFTGSDDFWDQVYNLDCEEGLARLSGHPAVRGERFTFRRTTGGKANILVDGKGTSCWVDAHGRIGSADNGGPTIAQWLRWYGLTYAEAAKVIKELYPQLAGKR